MEQKFTITYLHSWVYLPAVKTNTSLNCYTAQTIVGEKLQTYN